MKTLSPAVPRLLHRNHYIEKHLDPASAALASFGSTCRTEFSARVDPIPELFRLMWKEPTGRGNAVCTSLTSIRRRGTEPDYELHDNTQCTPARCGALRRL